MEKYLQIKRAIIKDGNNFSWEYSDNLRSMFSAVTYPCILELVDRYDDMPFLLLLNSEKTYCSVLDFNVIHNGEGFKFLRIRYNKDDNHFVYKLLNKHNFYGHYEAISYLEDYIEKRFDIKLIEDN